MAWNISTAKRRALVKLQLRDKKGRWIEMGKGVKWYSHRLKKQVGGTVVGGKEQNVLVRLNPEYSTDKKKGDLVSVPANSIEIVDDKATLPGTEPSAADTPEFEEPDAVAKVAPASEFPFEGSKLSEVSAADMSQMPKGSILRADNGSGSHFLKQDGDSWQHFLSNGQPSGTVGTSVSVKNFDAFQNYTFAKKGSDPWANPNQTSQPEEVTPAPASEGAPSSSLSVSQTSDGNTYITAPEGAELYTPAKELAVGDEVIAPDGAHPQKPFSMGKGWAYKSAERVNTQGPKIGKVLSIKEHAYAVVQLPEGETVESTQKPGEQTNTVTIGLSNKVIKATPELKESLKDIIPEPTYAAPEAPKVSAEDAKQAKRLDMLKKAPAGSTVKAKDGSVGFVKDEQGNWSTDNGSPTTPEDISATVAEENKKLPEGSGSAFVIDMATAVDPNAVAAPAPEKSYLELAGPEFAAMLKEEPTFKYGLKNKDEEYGGFDAYRPAERKALEEYVASSTAANSALRLGGNVSSGTAQTIAGMDSILDRSALLGDTKVYRGVGASKAMLDEMLTNGVMADFGFTSTSVDKDFAESWVAGSGTDWVTPVIMEINLPKGFKAHKVDYDAAGPGFDHENEVILPRSLAFDITGVEEYTDSSGKKAYRVQATPLLNEKNYDPTIGASNDAGSTADPASGDAGTDTAVPAPAGEDGNPVEAPAGDGQQPLGEVRDNSGSGSDAGSGGSTEAPGAEPSPEATGTNSGASGSVDTAKGVRRNRETIMAELQPLDTSNWKKVGAQAGSNPGGVFEDQNGQKWYVKQSKSESHARAEVLADQLYKAAGIDASGLKLTTFNGKKGTASPMIDGAKNDLSSKIHNKDYLNKIREGFAVDAWLANWDVLGLEDDNIVTDSSGNPVRIDTGGTMMFRAQGGLKNAQQPGAWGNDVKDWDGLRKFGTAQKAYKDITDQQLVDSAARVESVTPEEIDAMVDALGYKEPDASEIKNTLKARREDIISKASALSPAQDSNESEARVEDAAPVKPKYPKATKENPNVLQGYTIEQNENGVYFPKERLDMAAWDGLRKGTIVPPSLPFIPFNTTSGEVHYWDSEGNRHWGQFGGAGALTRRKNADGQFEYLLAQRASSLSTAPNMWSTPGGAHATKEDSQIPGQTAKAEMAEELGMDVNGNPVANYKHSTAPDWAYDYSIFDAPEGAEPDAFEVDTREIQDMKWMTADEIKSLKADGKLHPAMSEVLDDLLNASESVDTDVPETETPNEDSNAPEAPSQAADTVADAPLSEDEIAAKVDEAVKFGEGADPADVQAAKDALTKLVHSNQGTEASSEDDSATEPMPIVQTDGPSAVMADGKPAYVGSRVTHDTFGHGTVVQIIAGKSAKIEFDDGITKISQAHKINSHDKGAAKNSPADTSGMAPGEFANNPSSGKLFIVGSDNSAIYQGDKVEAMHQGEMRSGVVKGIYKSNHSVAIIFDGESKPVTKKASTVNSLESAPEAPTTDAPAVDAPSSDAPKYDADGYTPEEAAQVAKLEKEVSEAYQGLNDSDIDALESQLDELYAKGEARLAGKDVPETAPEAPEDVVDSAVSDEPVAAPESDIVSEPVAEPAPAPAVDENPLDDNFEKLPGLTEYHKGDVAVLKDGRLAQWVGKGKLTLEDGSQIMGNKFSVDGKDIVVAGKDIKSVYRPKKMVMASSSTHPFGEGFYGYSFDLSKPNGDNFKPGDHVVYGKENNEGKIMSVNPTNILVQKLNSDKNVPGTATIVAGQVHGVYRKDGSKTPTQEATNAPEAPAVEETPAAPEADEQAPKPDVAPETPEAAPEAPEGYTAANVPVGSYMPIGDSTSSFVKDENGEWEMFINDYPTGVKSTDDQVQKIADNTGHKFKVPTHLREQDEADAKAKAAEEEAKAEAPANGYTEPELLADWEKELLQGGSDPADDGVVNLDNLSDEQKKALGFEPEAVKEPFVPTEEQAANAREAVKKAEAESDGPVSLDDLTPEQKKALGFETVEDSASATPQNPAQYTDPNGITYNKPYYISQGLWDTYSDLEKKQAGEIDQPLNPAEYLAPDGVKYYKPATMSQGYWDSLEGWEKELTGNMVKPTPVNNYYDAQGVEMIAPSGAILDDLNIGATIVTSDKNADVWTKTQDGPTGYGDGVWTDQNGQEASSEEIANGADVKVTSFGDTTVDEEIDPAISKIKADVVDLPIGTKLGDPNDYNLKKIDDDLWYFYNGDRPTEQEALDDQEVAEFANAYDDFKPSLAILPADDSTKEKTPLENVAALPVGTTVGFPDAELFFVKEGDNLWTPKHTSDGVLENATAAPWVSQYTDEKIAALSEASDEYSLDTAKLPQDTPEGAKDTASEVSKLPIGAKLGDPKAMQFEKVSANKWEDLFAGEPQNLVTYTDSEVAELVDGLPGTYGMDTLTTPEGSAAPEEESTDIGSLGGMDKAEFQKAGIGTKVVYSNSGKASEPTGTYEKTGTNEWSYTPEGSESPTKTGITSDTFDHLFEADVDNSKYSINNKRTRSAEVEAEVEDTSGVTKGVKIYSNADLLEGYPLGTTLKPEKNASYYYPNNTFFVKQEDGTWQEFKKTAKKTMKGMSVSSAGLSYQMQYATISQPVSTMHAVLSTGEIVYVGDTVTSGIESFTVKSIKKAGLDVVDQNGVKKLMKPHALMKDADFGTPQVSNNPSYAYGSDPLSESSKAFKKAQQKKVEAKLEADKLIKDLQTFAGGSADEYDAQGVTMKSDPNPPQDNGLTVMEATEVVDTTNPWYGKPQPAKPSENYPMFAPPTPDPLPKWDSEKWLEKVKQRYLDNPNKAKANLESSNKWSSVQAVLNGDKSQLDGLLNSMYLDEDLKKEAEEGMAAQDKLNAPLKKKIVDEAKIAKAEYDKKKAEHDATLAEKLSAYDKDLKEWIKANPNPDAYKKAKKPPVSTQNFEGGEADWTKAHVGTYTAKSVFDSMRDDNVLGSHGLSIATDSDQIEDLDVKVTKVLDTNGNPKFELKFKLTAPHGKAFEQALKNDSKVSADDTGIYPTHMVKDADTGLFKDSGKPVDGFVNQGTRYSYTDPMTGAKVVFQKSPMSGYNVSSNDNTVKIHMPLDSTPEMFQQTLENLGIKKARPSTQGDIKVLAENKLISLMGSHQGNLKSFDGRMNMSGDDRKKALDKIKQDYGVTADDLTFRTEPNGRVKLFFSDEKASELAKKYNVTYFGHNVKGSSDPNRWINMLSGKNTGMLSTYHRFTEGIGGQGQSSTSDMANGAGDYNYITPHSAANGSPNNQVGLVLKPNAIFKRTDFWANPGDGWGKKAEGGSTSNMSPYKLFDSKGSIGYSGYGSGVYEVLPKDSVPLADFAYVVVPPSVIDSVLKGLKDKGILEINGIPVDKFVIKPGDTPPIDLTTPGAA